MPRDEIAVVKEDTKNKNNNNNRKPRLKVDQQQQILEEIRKLKGSYKPGPLQFATDYKTKANKDHSKALQVYDFIDGKNLSNVSMSRMISRKVIEEASRSIQGRQYSSLNEKEKRFVLECVLGDDWGTVLKTVAPPVLNYLWG